MQYDFELLCKRARDGIAVPSMPRVITEAAPRKPRLLAAAFVTLVSTAAAAAAAIVGTGYLTFTPKGGIVLSGDVSVTDRVSAANVAAIVRRADFPVTLPSGLPAGARLKRIVTGGTSVIALQYDLPGAWRRGNHTLYVFLANRAVMNERAPKNRPQSEIAIPKRSMYRVEFFAIRGEAVTVAAGRAAIADADVSRMKSAMESAASSR